MQVKMLASYPDAVGNYTGVHLFKEDGSLSLDVKPIDATMLRSMLRRSNPGLAPSTVMLRRAVIERVGPFSESLLTGEDWELWIRLTDVGEFCTCPEPLTNYQISSTGLCGDADVVFDDFMKILDDVLLKDLSGLRRVLWRRRIISYQEFKACLTARGAGDKAKERAYMKRSMMTWPSPFWAPERLKTFAVTLLRS